MGGEFCSEVVSGDLDRNTLHDKFKEIVAEAEYEDGHGGYTGTFAEKNRLEVSDRTFGSVDEAENWINEVNDKWGPAMAVLVCPPDNPDKRVWVIGGWCSS